MNSILALCSGTTVEAPSDDAAQRLVDKAKAGAGTYEAGDPTTDDLKIILWANGFQAGENEPLRDFKDPKNK